jgi:hypothetical protein
MLFAQNLSQEFDYYQIRNGKKAFYDQHPILKTTPGSGYKDFLRWEYFWQTRIGWTDSNSRGDMRMFNKAMTEFQQKYRPGATIRILQ